MASRFLFTICTGQFFGRYAEDGSAIPLPPEANDKAGVLHICPVS